jgi:hypothetical protein
VTDQSAAPSLLPLVDAWNTAIEQGSFNDFGHREPFDS